MKFTKEQTELLKPLENVFDTVLNSKYKKGTTRAQNELVAATVNAAKGTNHKFNLSCSQCVFNLYKEAATIYFDSLVVDEPEPTQTISKLEDKVINKTTVKKKGRSKK